MAPASYNYNVIRPNFTIMKLPIISTAAVTLTALASTVQADLKLASVDVNLVYTKYYKRFETEEHLRTAMTEIRTEVEKRQAEISKLMQEFETMRAQHDPSRSDKENAELRKKLEAKRAEILAKQEELKQYVDTRQKAFQELYSRDIQILFADVQKCIKDEAARAGYDLVIDSSAINGATRTKVFPHVNVSYDITPQMIQKINADAPAGFDADAELRKAGINLPQQ
ncbi:MAG: OmpH family outer membrane protein [Akkermansiaceae bacterium]|nr:OmpH family outer membrane protein [Akkermansiaceae bacterium]